jgi:hypothetical protein
MSMIRRSREILIALAATALMAISLAACGLVAGGHADCNVVRLQREAGRSDAEIASALGVSESDVGQCPGGAKMEFGGQGGAEGSATPGAESAPSGEPNPGGEPPPAQSPY